jgi:hemerythrin superfamily protein
MPVKDSPTRSDGNVVDLMLKDHERITAIIQQFDATPAGKRRRALWDDLMHTLAVHEAAEDDVIYPRLRRDIPAGDSLVALLREAGHVKHAVEALENEGADSRDFASHFHILAAAVLEHIRYEEDEVWPLLRSAETAATLRRLGASYELAKHDELRASLGWV